MQIKTRVKAGQPIPNNHNETLVRVPRPAPALKVKTHVKAGGITYQHNETLVRDKGPAPSLTVKTGVKAGALTTNHNETLVRVVYPLAADNCLTLETRYNAPVTLAYTGGIP